MEHDRTLRIPQSAVVPIIEENGEVKVVLITSSQSAHSELWGIPKGLIEPHLSPQESAANEAWEEAGLLGAVEEAPIGFYEYAKWDGICEVDVYLMRVQETLDAYPESGFRKRMIVDLNLACDLVANKDVASILRELRGKL
jgi:8-oxo-dGTP pyrophosphatase MutT (NUDIX family)